MAAVAFNPSPNDLAATQPTVIPSAMVPREKTKRPQLSCNPCRQRKVKCDRIQPCTACSLHQIAEICQYDLTETERHPILQAEALKEKDRAIASLRNEIQLLQGQSIKSEPCDDFSFRRNPQKMRLPPRVPVKPAGAHQRRFHNGTLNDSIYFGSPAMASVVEEFASLSVNRQGANLTHAVPRGTDVYSYQMSKTFPFPTLWSAHDDSSTLVKLLPPEQEILAYLNAFQRRAQSCSFPHVPEECTEREIRRFLSNVEHNAAVHLDMLALVFCTLAQGLQNGVYDKYGERWVAGAVETESKKADVWIAAAMQCLRLSSCLSRPTLLTVQALVMMSPYLTNSGKFLDAWALFGMTIRLAQSIGLHRDPGQLNPSPPLKEVAVRKNLWWWMLHMDQQFSMTLGRPLGISSMGDCPAPEPLVADPMYQSLSNYLSQFSILARQILSTGYLTVERIDSFTDQLLALKATLPDMLNFNKTWLNRDSPIPPWPLDAQASVLHGKTHNFLLLLNRQRISNARNNDLAENLSENAYTDAARVSRGRDRVLTSCRELLHGFAFFHTRVRAAMICWTTGQHAFNASMILVLSALETREVNDLEIVKRTYSIFLEMKKLGIHKLAGAAVERLGALMKEFQSGESAKETVMGRQGMILLEDAGLPSFSDKQSFSPLGFQMAGGALEYDGSESNLVAGDTRVGEGQNSAAKSSSTQRAAKKAAQRKSAPGRGARVREPTNKQAPRRRRSIPYGTHPRQLSPKMSHAKTPTIHSAGAAPPPGSLPFSFSNPTLSEPIRPSMLTPNETSFSDTNAFDSQSQPLHDLNFDPVSQPHGFRQHRRTFSQSGSDPGIQPFAFDAQIAPADLLDDSFHATTQAMDYGIDDNGFKQYQPPYAYSMAEIPCSTFPPY